MPCAADGLLSRETADVLPSAPKYLLYAPQFGLSNQLVALRNAVAWAQLLNRTLVLPHLLAHGTVYPRAPFGNAFDVSSARAALSPLRVIDVTTFLSLGLAPAGVLALQTTNRFRPADAHAYFDALGVTWHRGAGGAARELSVPMQAMRDTTAFSPAAILRTFGGCGARHRVLAFQSLFAAFDPKPLSPSPPEWRVCTRAAGSGGSAGGAGGDGGASAAGGAGGGAACSPGLQWLDQQALPALLTPTAALDGVAKAMAARLQAADAGAPAGRMLGCVHIRRGDFTQECVAYEAELTRRDARPWVRSHFRQGWGCLQTESELALNMRAAANAQRAAGGRPLAFYAAIEEPAALARMPSLRLFNVSTLATFEAEVARAALPLPPALAAILLDQLTCARAERLLLNAFSTFSQLVMGRIGLWHAESLGWVRDLNRRQQRQLGVNVAFWKREKSPGRLM